MLGRTGDRLPGSFLPRTIHLRLRGHPVHRGPDPRISDRSRRLTGCRARGHRIDAPFAGQSVRFDAAQRHLVCDLRSRAEVIDNVYPAGITVRSPGDAVDVKERGRPDMGPTWCHPRATRSAQDPEFLLGGRSGRIRSCCRERFGQRKCGSPSHGRILRRPNTGCLSYRRRPSIQPGPAPGISTPLRYWPPGPVSSNQ